jgi:hypothetical protein
MPLVIAVLLGISGLIIVVYPLLGLERQAPDALPGGPLADVAERERSARDALREVEFDHRLGNLDDEDYSNLRARYERRALAALKVRYQREQELDALIEQQLATLRTQLDAPTSDVVAPTPLAPPDRTPPQSIKQDNRPSRNGARPASGPQARRRRGGRG